MIISQGWNNIIGNNNERNKKKEGDEGILKDVEELRKTEISQEEWLTKLLDKHQALFNVVNKNISNLWPILEFSLSIKSILNIKDCTLPFAGIILGPPSSLKTTVIELFRGWPQTYYTDNFSAKSFVSHSTAVTREQLAEIDMLPKIKNKLFLTPELAPTFSSKDDDLIQVLGIMTRILDGHGYESDTGAHGHRGYSEDIMFAQIGAADSIALPRNEGITMMLEEKLPLTSHNFSEGLDFILDHFQGPIFPRTISTWRTENKQVEVFGKEKAINLFEYSKFIDCKINAYPTYTEYKGINRQAPNFIFIDLDRLSFNSEKALKITLQYTLKNIKEKLNGAYPTVLWSGNGYHIYLPIDSFVLEQVDVFNKFENPSNRFLKIAEVYLSNGKSDQSHTPSFKSCMIRIPGSQNSKCIVAGTNSEVQIIQRWDGYRPKISLLLGSFHAYLVDQQIKEKEREKSIEQYQNNTTRGSPKTIVWIEKLLQTPIEDYRKNAVSLILAPYLINIRGLPYQSAYNIIEEWLDKCDALRKLDRNFRLRIRYALNTSINKRIPPLKLETLRSRNKWLYDKLVV